MTFGRSLHDDRDEGVLTILQGTKYFLFSNILLRHPTFPIAVLQSRIEFRHSDREYE